MVATVAFSGVAFAATSGPNPNTSQTTPDAPCVEDNGIQCPIPFDPNINANVFVNLINTVANWLFTFLLVLAVIFIVLAAYKYLFSSGDAEAVESAHKMLMYAAVAVAVALLSRGFVYVIRNVTTGGTGGSGGTSQQGGGTGGGTGGGAGGGSPTFSTVSSFVEFGVRVQVCSDNKIPGIIITDQDEPTGSRRVSNFTDASGNVDLNGNPEIDSSQSGAAANAGEFNGVGTVDYGSFLGLGIIGGTEYSFAVETCNNGQIPAVIYNTGNGSQEWQQL